MFWRLLALKSNVSKQETQTQSSAETSRSDQRFSSLPSVVKMLAPIDQGIDEATSWQMFQSFTSAEKNTNILNKEMLPPPVYRMFSAERFKGILSEAEILTRDWNQIKSKHTFSRWSRTVLGIWIFQQRQARWMATNFIKHSQYHYLRQVPNLRFDTSQSEQTMNSHPSRIDAAWVTSAGAIARYK